jgi:penicillin-binding protein 2
MLVNKHGAIVAIDPNNGEVWSLQQDRILIRIFLPDLINLKTYTLYQKIRFMKTNQLSTVLYRQAYPPGSTFKLLTALAAMQMGVMDEKTIFPCGGGFFTEEKN